MRIDGEWFPCDDEKFRPIIRGEVLSAAGTWEPTLFLLDTGADCTVLSAAILDVLGIRVEAANQQLGGIGGIAPCVQITTKIRFPTESGSPALFSGSYRAMTKLESLDFSVIGRDILNLFAVIVDRGAEVVALLRPPHRYSINRTAK